MKNVHGFNKSPHIADYLNTLSEKKFRFSALENKNCSTETILHTMAELKELPFYLKDDYRKNEHDVRDISENLMEQCVALLMERNVSPECFQTSTDELNRYFLAALRDLQERNFRDALRNLQVYDSYGPSIFQAYPHLHYYKGLALYGLGAYAPAQDEFSFYCSCDPRDEMSHFYLGNTLAYLGKYREALAEYLAAIDIYRNFKEAFINSSIIAEKLKDLSLRNELLRNDLVTEDMLKKFHRDAFEYTLSIDEKTDIWDIPVFINSYNRLNCLKKLVDWLSAAGCKRIYILDNRSTYPPLHRYYDALEEQAAGIRILRLAENFGYKALWLSGILEELHINGPYVYTDSDVVPTEKCPKDFLQNLLDILRKYPFLKKVGLGLKTDDITYFDAKKTQAAEKRFYLHNLEPNVYFGAVDTTLALYRNYHHYNIYVSARTTGKLMAHHLPWYYDYQALPDDEAYYMEHANSSATLAMHWKKTRQTM